MDANLSILTLLFQVFLCEILFFVRILIALFFRIICILRKIFFIPTEPRSTHVDTMNIIDRIRWGFHC